MIDLELHEKLIFFSCNTGCVTDFNPRNREKRRTTNSTYSSVTSLGIPLGKNFKPLLLHRTTVSKQVHSEGQRGSGEQLLSSFPRSPHKIQKTTDF